MCRSYSHLVVRDFGSFRNQSGQLNARPKERSKLTECKVNKINCNSHYNLEEKFNVN